MCGTVYWCTCILLVCNFVNFAFKIIHRKQIIYNYGAHLIFDWFTKFILTKYMYIPYMVLPSPWLVFLFFIKVETSLNCLFQKIILWVIISYCCYWLTCFFILASPQTILVGLATGQQWISLLCACTSCLFFSLLTNEQFWRFSRYLQ